MEIFEITHGYMTQRLNLSLFYLILILVHMTQLAKRLYLIQKMTNETKIKVYLAEAFFLIRLKQLYDSKVQKPN